MTIRRGMQGDTVRGIQERLRELSFLNPPIDGDFGGGTEGSVKRFQKARSLAPTGIVDGGTWSELFPGRPAPVSPMASAPLANRCLALTGSFETGKQPPECFCGVTGDFDGQGISFGVLQWNIGTGSLQGLLKDVFELHGPVCEDIFHEHLDTMKSLGAASPAEQLDFVRSIQTGRRVNEPWFGMLKTLGRTPEFQDVQVKHASEKFKTALKMCAEYGLKSERAAALMFDIVTQNGSIGPVVKAQIQADFASIAGDPDEVEVGRMRSIANRRAAVAKPEFVDDVRRRKLTIAEGHGTVHGILYDLDDMFSIRLKPMAASTAQPA